MADDSLRAEKYTFIKIHVSCIYINMADEGLRAEVYMFINIYTNFLKQIDMYRCIQVYKQFSD